MIYYISDQLMNMINTVKYLLKCKEDMIFPTGNNGEELYLQRQFSVFRMLLLPRGSCAALNLNISLEGKE